MNKQSKAMCEDGQCPVCQKPTITKPLLHIQDILLCLKQFRDKKQEYFVCLSLDSGQRLINQRVITIGLLNVSLAHPREVFAGALIDRAASVIIAHNHPSGVAAPSNEDIKTTQQLVATGILLGIPLRDHVIITEGEFFSFSKNRLV
jgi:DNA repair protein RadC